MIMTKTLWDAFDDAELWIKLLGPRDVTEEAVNYEEYSADAVCTHWFKTMCQDIYEKFEITSSYNPKLLKRLQSATSLLAALFPK